MAKSPSSETKKMTRTGKRIDKMFHDMAQQKFNENMRSDSVYVSFPQYVGIVQEFLTSFVTKRRWRRKGKTLAVFTGLCITPLQWFNYCLVPKPGEEALDVVSLEQVRTFYTDPDWLKYHRFLIRLRCAHFPSCPNGYTHCISQKHGSALCPSHKETVHVRFYRHLLSVTKHVELHEGYHLPLKDKITEQLNGLWISFPPNELVYKVSDLLKSDDRYNVKNADAYAYNILPSDPGNGMKLGEVFATYFQAPSLCNINIDGAICKLTSWITPTSYNLIWQNSLPLDFILFGHSANSDYGDVPIEPLFALGCNVSENKVKLSLLMDDRIKLLEELVNSHLLRIK